MLAVVFTELALKLNGAAASGVIEVTLIVNSSLGLILILGLISPLARLTVSIFWK